MKSPRGKSEAPPPHRASAAFLLAQAGAHAAARFAERLASLNLAPPHAGILWILGSSPSLTQRALARTLRMLPSQLVALLDDLESRGLVERRDNPEDRRSHALYLTAKGRTTLEAVGRVSREHQQALLAALREDEQKQLAFLLQRIADQQGLTRGVHPGYAGLRHRPRHRRK